VILLVFLALNYFLYLQNAIIGCVRTYIIHFQKILLWSVTPDNLFGFWKVQSEQIFRVNWCTLLCYNEATYGLGGLELGYLYPHCILDWDYSYLILFFCIFCMHRDKLTSCMSTRYPSYLLNGRLNINYSLFSLQVVLCCPSSMQSNDIMWCSFFSVYCASSFPGIYKNLPINWIT
jgi:hypothetical protein